MDAKKLETLCIGPNSCISDAMKVIDKGECGITLVVDKKGRLLGILTDKEVRTALLSGKNLNSPILDLFNKKPLTLPFKSSLRKIRKTFLETGKSQIPLLTKDGKIKDLVLMTDSLEDEVLPNRVVIMAGGKGRRLYPLTLNTPKPMLHLKDKPILETLVNQVSKQGFKNISISVNYLAQKIEKYFGDGSSHNSNISYLRENTPLGTAGALSSLKEEVDPIIVINGDLLTTVNFRSMLLKHKQSGMAATVGVRKYEQEVPYGVLELEGNQIKEFKEKPINTHFINAGIYILEPGSLKLIKENNPMDMPELLQRVMDKGKGLNSYLIQEYWKDLGLLEDLKEARKDIGSLGI